MSADLKPGDFCLVLPATDTTYQDVAKRVAGCTVILLKMAVCFPEKTRHAPFWYVTGLKGLCPEGMSLSHEILQKLPPAFVEEDERDEEELLA